MKGVWLEDLTWLEAKEWFDRDALVVIPVGASSKEHGPHLPLKTDYLLARGFTDRLLARVPVVAAPVLTLGYYPAFRLYPGSQCLTPDTFGRLLDEVLSGFERQGVKNMLIFNTGVSTEGTITNTVREFENKTGLKVAVGNILALGRGAPVKHEQKMGTHADEHETSIMMSMFPEWVRTDQLVTDYGDAKFRQKTALYIPGYMNPEPDAGGVHHPTGVFGDATLASKEKGDIIVKAVVDDLEAGIRAVFADAIANPPTMTRAFAGAPHAAAVNSAKPAA